MKLAIIGSRDFNDYKLLTQTLETYRDKITIVVSGAARGADSLGEKWAIENKKETLIFPADWDKYGKRAGYIRNEDIIKNSDCVIS
jgi:predicted Rossmann fold nucleotide-binding protein DprA/Smf involved in DNA uptake